MTTDELRAIAEAATPGPWAWFHGKYDTYLATVNRGRIYVMGFARRGMQDAQPMFQVRENGGPGVMRTASEIGEAGLRTHPDARHIATFDPRLALALLDVARTARALRTSGGMDTFTPEADVASQDLDAALARLEALA